MMFDYLNFPAINPFRAGVRFALTEDETESTTRLQKGYKLSGGKKIRDPDSDTTNMPSRNGRQRGALCLRRVHPGTR